MEIAIAVFIGAWFTLAGGFSTWMVFRDYKKALKDNNTTDKGANRE